MMGNSNTQLHDNSTHPPSPYLKASFSSCSIVSLVILDDIIMTNSLNSSTPLRSASTSFIMSATSDSVGFCPSDLRDLELTKGVIMSTWLVEQVPSFGK